MTLAQTSFAELEIRRARRDGPETSREAARDSHGIAAEHHLLILAALRDFGPMSCTEIAARTSLHAHQVGKRMHELCSAEIAAVRIVDGITRPTAAGRPSRVYEILQRTGT